MGVVNTTYTFQATDTITSAKMNNIIDQTTITGDAISGTTLEVTGTGKLKIRSQGITSNELATGAVNTNAIEDGAITSGKLNPSVILVPAGAVMPFAMNSAPTGWVVADGTSVTTSAPYDILFAAIGYTYGGSGSAFNLPDLRGYFVRGAGTNSDATASGAFGAKQADEFKSHTHTSIYSGDVYMNANPGIPIMRPVGSGGYQAVNYTGGDETRPKNIAMLYCIKY